MLTHPDIDPVAVSLGPISIHWYGLMYLVGFAAAWGIAVHRSGFDNSPIQRKHVDDLIFYSALGAVLGGRFGYVMFYNFDKFLLDPLWLFKLWEGGMSFHGGLLGVFVAMIVFSRKLNVKLGALVDFVAPMAPVGLGMGRVGNFIGQELWGRPADVDAVPWAMVFPKDPSGLARHPSQLYQALLEGGVLLLIVYSFSARPRPNWSVAGLFLIGYGVFRFVVEFFRAPDSHIGFDAFGWLTRGQVLSLPMIVGGVALMIYAYRWQVVESPKPGVKSGKKSARKNR
ncbi:MAG: prolipoprotein diacylglyceryl transferase [Oceanicoccus sp.]